MILFTNIAHDWTKENNFQDYRATRPRNCFNLLLFIKFLKHYFVLKINSTKIIFKL